MKNVFITLLIVSVLLNIGLISGFVRIGSPAKFEQMAYTDSQRALMTALMEDVK